MTTSEAIEIALVAITVAKQQAIAGVEKFTEKQLIPALQELERESGISCAVLNDPDGIILDEERPDNNFNEALEVLGKALSEFQDFEETLGGNTSWELTEPSY
jgi:hypothetical protein